LIKRFIDRHRETVAVMAIAKKITINDVAQVAGVSVSTVSLVLSGKGRISSATGERVNQAIEQLGLCVTARRLHCAAGRAA
jgi:LacI family transcriptional regulator of maltose regulon